MDRTLTIPSTLHHPVLSTAIEAAMIGSQVLVDHFQRDLQFQEKGIGELVSIADIESEKSIVATIHQTFPKHAILAEEGHQVVQDSEHLWIIDPLDGTNNFAHRIPHFAISIAYAVNGVVECGVITNPISGDWFIAVRGQGAWHQGKRAHVNAHQHLHESMIALGFYYDRGLMMEATLCAARDFFKQHIHGVRRFGTASLDLAMVGCGSFGAYFEFQLSPWDFAAGKLFVEEAGGKVTDCLGEDLPLRNKTSILASNGHLHSKGLKITSHHWQQYKQGHADFLSVTQI